METAGQERWAAADLVATLEVEKGEGMIFKRCCQGGAFIGMMAAFLLAGFLANNGPDHFTRVIAIGIGAGMALGIFSLLGVRLIEQSAPAGQEGSHNEKLR